jgi:TonB family protein
MKSPRLFPLMVTCLLIGLWFGATRASAGEVKLIANSNVKADMVSADDLKRLFLEEKSSLPDGTHVEPVLERGGRVHEAFLQEYLGKTAEDLQTYYRALVFTGRGSMPKQLNSDADVVAYVAKTKGAIGYVGAATGTEGVKTLAVTVAMKDPERKLITRIQPEYPETLKRLSIGGTVRLQVTISPKGDVEKVEVLGGNPILGEAAISAVKQWVYAASRSRTVAEVSIPFDARQ